MIIGLTGPAGCGKSTAALYLTSRYGAVRTRFAAPLKAMLRGYLTCIGVDAEQQERMLEGDLKETPVQVFGGQTPRYVMQTLGTEWGREFINPDFWTDAWWIIASRAIRAGRDVSVEDCRFQNEADAIRNAGGFILEIKRPGLKRAAHVSEAGIQPDLSIWNDGPHEILAARLDGIIDRRRTHGSKPESSTAADIATRAAV